MAIRPTKIYGISLCAGIGGIDLGLSAAIPGYKTVVFVEREAFCANILAARMADGQLSQGIIWDDIKTFDGRPWRKRIQVVAAGFPCQPFSCAGIRKGNKDDRHLWPDVARIIEEVGPAFCFLENVPGLVSLGLQNVCADLYEMGYQVSAGIFSAAECGAPHVRKRLFILAASTAASDRQRELRSGRCQLAERRWPSQPLPDVADAQHAGGRAKRPAEKSLEREYYRVHAKREENCGGFSCCGETQRVEAERLFSKSPLGGENDGISTKLDGWGTSWEDGIPRITGNLPDRSHRLAALGNAVVPACAAKAWGVLSKDALGARTYVLPGA